VTDGEILKLFKESTETTISTLVFYNHVIGIVAQQSGVDINSLIGDIKKIDLNYAESEIQPALIAIREALILILEPKVLE
jgi:hypothetical protein